MAKKVMIGSVVGAIILFFWGFAYWGFLQLMMSPWRSISPDDNADLIAAAKSLPSSGVYVYPWIDASQTDQSELEEKFEAQQKEGPRLRVVYHSEGLNAQGTMMLFGFLHMVVSALTASVLLAAARPHCCYAARVAFVVGLGLFASIWVHGADVIWWFHPPSHLVFMAGYEVVGWLLAGLAIGAIVKDSGQEPPVGASTVTPLST